MAVEVEVEDQSIMGTRIIMLADGTSLSFSKPDDSEIIRVRLTWPTIDRVGLARTGRISFMLKPDEALSIIEILAIAARPHTGKTLVEAICEHYDAKGGLLVKGSDD